MGQCTFQTPCDLMERLPVATAHEYHYNHTMNIVNMFIHGGLTMMVLVLKIYSGYYFNTRIFSEGASVLLLAPVNVVSRYNYIV